MKFEFIILKLAAGHSLKLMETNQQQETSMHAVYINPIIKIKIV